jgi:guanine deaminase
MCFAAIHWAKIPICKYAAQPQDAASVGFDDQFIYDVIRGTATEEKVKMEHLPHPDRLTPFHFFTEMISKAKSQLY